MITTVITVLFLLLSLQQAAVLLRLAIMLEKTHR